LKIHYLQTVELQADLPFYPDHHFQIDVCILIMDGLSDPEAKMADGATAIRHSVISVTARGNVSSFDFRP
jgi:hypothetical protein